jgi:LPS export ABC transporter protein LptC
MERRGLVARTVRCVGAAASSNAGSGILRDFILLAAAMALFTAAMAGCSLDYGTAMAEDLGDGVPDAVVYGFTHTVVEKGLPRFRIEAERGESYRELKKMKLTKVAFVEFAPDDSGSMASEGSADSAVFYTDTESAELSGSVRLKSTRDGVTINSSYLKWDGEARLLDSRADAVTTLQDDKGSRLSGSGFSVDAARRSFRFGNQATGLYAAPEPGE